MTDPNADLYGFQYTTAEGTPAEETVTVIGPCDWPTKNYVKVRFPTGHETIKPVALIRERKSLDNVLASKGIHSDSPSGLPGPTARPGPPEEPTREP